ncbi:MAG: putative solute-binding protein [Thalassolituus sp.]
MKTPAVIFLLLSVMFSVPGWSTETRNDLSLNNKNIKKLEETVLNQNLTLEKRIKALKVLLSDQMVDGHLKRTFCIWDPLGKNGPVAAATRDQILRSLHYGMDLSIEVFQNEETLVNKFTRDNDCDAILIRGASAMRFNRFLATVEAPGAITSRDQLYLLAQVLAKPDIAPRLSDEKYTALGLVTLGGNHIFASSRKHASLSAFQELPVGIPDTDRGSAWLTSALKGEPQSASLPATVQYFSEGAVEVVIAPDIGYLVMGQGQTGVTTVAIKPEVGQSTLQLIGRAERFPPGLALILREDFLFRFNNYARLVDKELSNIPANFWVTPTEDEKKILASTSQETRLSLREQGFYDSAMLRLARKIRCRFEPANTECSNPIE